MTQETKNCQNCQQNFTIELEDFAFYDKISTKGGKVPPPTFCPECRMIRRMNWRNERRFYRRKCDFTGKDVISCFSSDSGIKIYDRDIWWSDQWDSDKFSLDLNFNKSFFIQFRKLLDIVPMPALFNGKSVNSNYCNHIGEFKDGYLVSASWKGENIMYSSRSFHSKDCIDNFVANNCELCYEVVESSKLYSVFFAQNSENSNNCYFIYNCKGCSNVFGSTNLRNKQFYIFNESYSKEEYFSKIKELDLGSYKNLQDIKDKFFESKKKSLRKFANIYHSQNATGDNIMNSFNCKNCFDIVGIVEGIKDSKFVVNALALSDTYDGYGAGGNAEMLYEVVDTGVQGSKLLFAIVVWSGREVYYSYNCHNCSNCFACIGLRNKQYCIFNKQYSKESFDKLRTQIINHMNNMPYIDKKGRIYKYGEFFPPELSPFSYNETIAQEYFPLTKEQALDKGYNWKDTEKRQLTITITNDQLPDHIKDIKDDIINQIIECQHNQNPPAGGCNEQCTQAFKIIPQELDFYRKMNLSLPRLCPNCRHYQRLKQRNPLKLWHRQCQCAGTQSDNGIYQNTITHIHNQNHCENEFQTTYSPERPEIVYCEDCYKAEVV